MLQSLRVRLDNFLRPCLEPFCWVIGHRIIDFPVYTENERPNWHTFCWRCDREWKNGESVGTDVV